MAVTVVKRPTGHKIIDTAIPANITDSSGDALVNFTAHGLTTGDTVYIVSDIDEYNGFWYITTSGANAFKIKEHATADFVEYFQDLDIEYYQTQAHDWNSIFLPIVYKITNNKWPENTADLTQPITSFTDDNGFTDIQVSSFIKLSIQALEFLKISGSSDESLNSVWQIVEIITSTRFVINLPYNATNDLVGASVDYYYNNYQVKVKIYAGLPLTHPWEAKKPYEEVAELSLTPDDNNEVMFSVSSYISSKVQIKNNLTLFSLPLNLDAFTAFYIAITETFDDSDGYTITTNELTPFADDSFEGYAIAGKLPFKNTYSGDYADYVYTNGSPALWLTSRDRLLGVEGYFFDISFIKNVVSDFIVRITKYISDYGIVEDVAYTDQGIGVYRIPITPDANYDSFCVQAGVVTEGVVTLDNTLFANSSGLGVSWTLGANPSLTAGNVATKAIYQNFPFIAGTSYTVIATLEIDNTSADSSNVSLYVGSSVSSPEFIEFQNFGVAGVNTETLTLIFTADTDSFVIAIDGGGSPTGADISTIRIMSVTVDDGLGSGGGFTPLTEEICIDILETCEVTNQAVQGDRRLLEDGNYRLLE